MGGRHRDRWWGWWLAGAVFFVAVGCAANRTGSGRASPTGPASTSDGAATAVVPKGTSSISSAPPIGSTPGSASTGGPPSPAGPPAAASAEYAAANGPVGAFARTLLRPQPANRLVFDILTQSDTQPANATVAHVIGYLRQVSGKPVSAGGPVPLSAAGGPGTSYTASQLDGLADSSSRAHQGAGQAVIHALFLHGTFQGDTSVLGVSVRGDVLVVFEDQIQADATPLVSAQQLEEAVTTHETGHILGLVGLVIDQARQDPQHPGHSTDQSSVMYWAVETGLVRTIFNGPPPVDFDQADLGDLTALRNGA